MHALAYPVQGLGTAPWLSRMAAAALILPCWHLVCTRVRDAAQSARLPWVCTCAPLHIRASRSMQQPAGWASLWASLAACTAAWVSSGSKGCAVNAKGQNTFPGCPCATAKQAGY